MGGETEEDLEGEEGEEVAGEGEEVEGEWREKNERNKNYVCLPKQFFFSFFVPCLS